MLKQKYFLTGIFILSAEKQPIKLAWRKIVWLPFLFNLGDIEASAQFESSAGDTKCLGANDMECIGASLNGKCKVQSTNNASIVSCDVVYVELGDCCGTKTVVTTW